MQLAIHSPETEKALLGQILINNDVIDKVGGLIPDPEVFYTDTNRLVWEAMSSMRRNGEGVIDTVTLLSKFKPNDDKVTAYYLTGLMEDVPTTANAENYAKILYEKWLIRKVVRKSQEIKSLMGIGGEKAYEVLQKLNNEIEDILNLKTREKFDLSTLVDNTIESIKAHNTLIPYNYGNLDKLTGGMTRGEITVIAGRPGHFKSTMMLNIVRNLVYTGQKVIVFNREMSNVEMMKKLIVMESDFISYGTLRSESMSSAEEKDLEVSKDRIKDNFQNLMMFDNIFDIDQAMREIRKHKPDVVVDDYIGLIDVFGVDDNRLRVDAIMKQYKRAAKTHNMCALLVSQLNRECESRANKRPILRDLRDSGSIEQDAESVLFMYYDYRYNFHESDGGENELEIILGKNRYGRTGSVRLGVQGDRCSIFNDTDTALKDMYQILKRRKENGSKV
jgi:replicative DNA helicase|tara:strand:+ start:284 stop:1624 length:1341 start_codon:yes stop_codon:yes gene_type:complete